MNENESLITREVIQSPEDHLYCQASTLDQLIDSMRLSEAEQTNCAAKHARKVIRDKALGLFKFGEIINTLLNWNDTVDKEIREKKKEMLLATYFERTNRNEYALISIKNFLTNLQGNTLFNKVLRILDDYPPDMELVGHLSSALKCIIDTDFVAMFEKHKYALSQIEQFTPQALTILADHRTWPIIQLGSYSSDGPRVTSDWLSEFTDAYGSSKSVSDRDTIARISHSISELTTRRIIEANLIGNDNAKCTITKIGRLILPYVDKGV
jgi:hypothetical protein